jgi:hypothetical protein
MFCTIQAVPPLGEKGNLLWRLSSQHYFDDSPMPVLLLFFEPDLSIIHFLTEQQYLCYHCTVLPWDL